MSSAARSSKTSEVRNRLCALASRERAAVSASYFKTAPGEYGASDQFHGITVPALRKLARELRDLDRDSIVELLHSAWHEERLLALLLLVDQFERTGEKSIYDLYLANTRFINNWDLVDASAPQIVGGWLASRSRAQLPKLAKSESLWERRIAIVATQHFIRNGDFDETLRIAALLLADPHDLIHKATGWMLREVGKRDRATLEGFLERHAAAMPRTMLRYAIERFAPDERARWLSVSRK